jgi:hypothetical protein
MLSSSTHKHNEGHRAVAGVQIGALMLRTGSASRHLGLGVAALALASISLAGCGSAAATPSLVDTYTSKVTTSDFQASGAVAGTISFTLSGQKYDGTYSGSFKMKGKDSSSTMTVAIAGTSSTTDQVSTGDSDYTRVGSGSWTKAPRSPSGMSIPDMVAGGLTDKGVETHNGQQLHRLDPVKAIEGKALFSDPNMSTGTFSVVLWAKDDGAPAGLSISGTWKQDMNGTMTDVTLAVDFDFQDLSGVTIEAPSLK